MSDQPSELVQGTLEMLVLKTLALEPIQRDVISEVIALAMRQHRACHFLSPAR